MFENTAFQLSLAYCGFILLIALIYYFNPPRSINSVYGYRTSRTMANDKVWKAANQYANKGLLYIAILSFIFPFVSYYMFPENMVLATVISSTLALLLLIPLTEIHLNKHFERDGTPK